ncbi:AIPR family protein [Cohnella fermenti]|uniref:AIPR protein n=1 Tax=Cohnella fermenti TaxID=2565925 RepID=A0A4S4BN14_9BACL|nr:AIPR family protein [Cohnella fermenti]THF76249.1 AIPR protein [Cohnella fermenti]
MDRITKSFLDDFSKSQQINTADTSKLFEHFVNYSIVSREYDDSFEIQDISVGDGGDCGIDGIAIIANGKLISSVEEIDGLIEMNKSLQEVKYIMIQSKTSQSFDGGEIGTFGFGVNDFFSETPQLVRNEFIKEKSKIIEYIISKFPQMKEKPSCIMYYVTTGKWLNDTNLTARIDIIKRDIMDLNLFKEVEFHSIDADTIQRFYRSTKDNIIKEINFENKVLLPEIEGIEQAYLGTLPLEEYFKLIIDESEKIRKSIFYDNVRDFQGENAVNQEINDTLQSSDASSFVVLNNGVTLVAKTLTNIRNKFTLEDYQVVNGCQTSHVLYNNRENINEKNVHLPIKLISTKNEDIINKIIKATNRQTEVTDEQLIALLDFHKKLESFYQTFEGPSKLYYERRSKQYNSVSEIEKVRIVTIPTQLKSFASMFLDQPHIASRFYGILVKDMTGKTFNENHELLPYYTGAYALYKLEFYFRNKSIDGIYRKFRFQMLMMLRYLINGEDMPSLNSKKINSYCEKINVVLNDQNKFLEAIKDVTSIINDVVSDLKDSEASKRQYLNEEYLKNIKSIQNI